MNKQCGVQAHLFCFSFCHLLMVLFWRRMYDVRPSWLLSAFVCSVHCTVNSRGSSYKARQCAIRCTRCSPISLFVTCVFRLTRLNQTGPRPALQRLCFSRSMSLRPTDQPGFAPIRAAGVCMVTGGLELPWRRPVGLRPAVAATQPAGVIPVRDRQSM